MKIHQFGLAVALTLAAVIPAARAQDKHGQDGVPKLDHVFVLVLENHNSFTSFGSIGILDNPKAPNITALANKYNVAPNYHGAWHPSLPNYLSMITGDWIGTDVSGVGHTYPAGSVVGISDDDSPSEATDYPSPANPSVHRWRVNKPSLAGQLMAAGKDWRAYLQNFPESGTPLANWPGDNNTAKLYAVKHNPFPYVAEVQDDPKQFAKQVPIDQLFSDLGSGHVPAFSYIVPDQCRDMHGLSSPLAPCGGASDTDDNDVKRGEGSLKPGADCYDPANYNDRVVFITITNYGVHGVQDTRTYNHFSLLKTVEAAFGLPYIGHAADSTTYTLAPFLVPADH